MRETRGWITKLNNINTDVDKLDKSKGGGGAGKVDMAFCNIHLPFKACFSCFYPYLVAKRKWKKILNGNTINFALFADKMPLFLGTPLQQIKGSFKAVFDFFWKMASKDLRP